MTYQRTFSGPPRVMPLVLSGVSRTALEAQARRLAGHLREHPGVGLTDVAWSLIATRTALPHRGMVVAGDRDAALSGLASLDVTGRVRGGGPGRIGFVFSGQGSQRAGMGRGLYDAFPVFAESFDEICDRFDQHLDRPLRSVVFAEPGSPDAALIDETEFTQPGLFAVEVALARLLAHHGLIPDVVCGHSIGELVGAHIAGALSLDDACRLVAARARLMQALPPGGAMAALEASEEEATVLIAGLEDVVSLAAVNSPTSVVLSGDAAVVDDIAARWKADGRRATRLRVSVGFHSPCVEPMLAEFGAAAATVDFQPPTVPLISNLTGKLVGDQVCEPDYWVRHARHAVRFGDGVTSMVAEGATTLVEVGPDAQLVALAHESLDTLADDVACWPTLRKGRDEPAAFLATLGHAWARGFAVDWSPLFADLDAHLVDLPTYAFQRERYWPELSSFSGSVGIGGGPGATDPAALGQMPVEHPLLGAGIELAGSEGVVFTGHVTLASHPWLADHSVSGAVVLPGTAFVEMALYVGSQTGCSHVEELVVEIPLVLSPHEGVDVQVDLAAPDATGRRTVTIHTRGGSGQPWTRHATGVVSVARPFKNGGPQVEWPPDDAEPVNVGAMYTAFGAAGLSYGPAFRGVRSAWRRDGEVFAKIALPDEAIAAGDGFVAHPAMVDAALHGLAVLAGDGDGAKARLPFAWTGVSTWSVPDPTAVLRVRLSPAGSGSGASIKITDEAGHPVLSVDSLVLREPPAALLESGGGTGSLFDVEWQPVEDGHAASLTSVGDWAVVGSNDLGLVAAGVTGTPWPDLGALADAVVVPDVVAMACPRGDDDVAARLRTCVTTVLGWVQAWLDDERFAASRLVLVTHLDQDIAHAPVWGLVLAAAAENPDRFVLVDVDTHDPGAALVAAVASGEAEVALRHGQLWQRRLARVPAEAPPTVGRGEWDLAMTTPGVLDGLEVRASELEYVPLEPHFVRISVEAAGLNFRDVLVALGVVELPEGIRRLGGEGAGVVVEVGSEVTGVAVGDRVMGLMGESMGSTIVTDYRIVVPIPEGWSYAQAAATTSVFLAAYYALVELADVQLGESVLVHSAAGGMGMAAVQLAHHLGATVYATAHPSKWDVVCAMGVDRSRVSSSRDVDFAASFDLSAGPIDVVLNSLTGDFVDASLRLLGAGGRFLEAGKTDVRDAAEVAEAYPGLHYEHFDVWPLSKSAPARLGELLRAVVDLFEQGALHPLPMRTWPMTEAPEAFRFMSQARHVGKLVLTRPGVDPEGTALITGGTGALGGLVARHLVEQHGVRSVVLTSRRGLDAPGAPELCASLERLGADVTIAACDTADREALAAVVGAVGPSRPLRTVVHTAGIVDDGLVSLLTPERLDAVMRPKALGAWNLHEVTRGLDVSSFVLFSSASGLSGAAGQGNYAAANVFLDELAAYRRSIGLPAVSLAWGLWEQPSGATDQLEQANIDRLGSIGVHPLATDDALRLFDAALGQGAPVMVPIRVDMAALRLAARSVSLPAVWDRLAGSPSRQLAPGGAAKKSGIDRPELLRRLADASSEAERLRVFVGVVQAEVATVLGYAKSDSIDVESAFKDLGFDSLTAVELRNRLNRLTGLRLPATLAFDYPTVNQLSREVFSLMAVAQPAA